MIGEQLGDYRLAEAWRNATHEGRMKPHGLDDYKVVLYRNQPDGWVAEIPSLPGCHALMPTAGGALAELAEVFRIIEQEHRENGKAMPSDTKDTTEIVHA